MREYGQIKGKGAEREERKLQKGKKSNVPMKTKQIA